MMLTYGGGGPSVLTSIPRDSQVDIPGPRPHEGQRRLRLRWPAAAGRDASRARPACASTATPRSASPACVTSSTPSAASRSARRRTSRTRTPSSTSRRAARRSTARRPWRTRARARRSPRGDIARGQHQREVIGAIGEAALSPCTVLNPLHLPGVATTAAESLAVGDDVSMFSFARFAWKLARAIGGDGRSCTVPIADLSVQWDRERARGVLRPPRERHHRPARRPVHRRRHARLSPTQPANASAVKAADLLGRAVDHARCARRRDTSCRSGRGHARGTPSPGSPSEPGAPLVGRALHHQDRSADLREARIVGVELAAHEIGIGVLRREASTSATGRTRRPEQQVDSGTPR